MIDTKTFFKPNRKKSDSNSTEHIHREIFYLQPFREKYDIVSTNDIFQMVDRIYKKPEEINYIAQQYGIEFDFENLPEGKLIGSAYYSTADKKIHIIISMETFIKIMNEEEKQTLKDDIAVSFVHENIHRQQDQGLNSTEGMKNYNDGSNLSTWKNIVSYMSQKDEVDAYASEVALDLMNHNMPISEFLYYIPKHLYVDYTPSSIKWFVDEFKDRIKNYDFIPSTLTTTAYYYLMGGDIWRRFLSKLYDLVPEKLRESTYLN